MVHREKHLDLMACTMHVDCGTLGLTILLPRANRGLGGRKLHPFMRGWIVVILKRRGILIHHKSRCAGRNNHTMVTAPVSVCSEKLSIVALSSYYGGDHFGILSSVLFNCLKCEWIWLNNGSLLHLTWLGFRDKHRSSTCTSRRGGGKVQVSR